MTIPYRPSLSERFGLDGPQLLRALVWSLVPASGVGIVAVTSWWEYGAVVAVAAGLLAFAVTGLVGSGGVLLFTHLSSVAAGRLLLPTGRSSPTPEDFSREQSLVIRGQVAEAIQLLARRCSAEPANAALHVFLADLYAGESRQPHHAARTFRQVKQIPRVSAAHDLYATQRLIDLYLGPLDNPDRAAQEMRHLVAKHPGSRAAADAGRLLRTAPPAPGRT